MTENTSVEQAVGVVETQPGQVATETQQPEAVKDGDAKAGEKPEAHWAEKRLSQMAAQKRELKAQLEAQAERIKALEQSVPKPVEKPITKEGYATEAEYIHAVAQREAQAIIAAEKQRDAENARANEGAQALQSSWVNTVKEMPDYAERIAAAEDAEVRIPRDMESVLRNSPDMPKVAYYLANNPEYASRLFAVPPSAIQREAVRLELKAETFWDERKAKPVEPAKSAKMPTLNGRAASAAPSLEQLRGDDYFKEYQRQLADKGRKKA
jgi:hypothetical protein